VQGLARAQIDSVVGAGKIQIMLNGKEVAWVRAGSTADPKLRGGKLIRNLQLVPGQKNAIEIFVNGERVKRTAYTMR